MRVTPANVPAALFWNTSGLAVFIRAAFTSQGAKSGRCEKTSAAAPAVSGLEKLVPLTASPPVPVPTSAR